MKFRLSTWRACLSQYPHLAAVKAMSSVYGPVRTIPGRRDRRENNEQSPPDTRRGSWMSERDLEKPAPDLAEQQRGVIDEPDDHNAPLPSAAVGLPLDVNEADAMEQYREVELDEDDYR